MALKEKLRESSTSTTLLTNAAPEPQPQSCKQSKSFSNGGNFAPESSSDVPDESVK